MSASYATALQCILGNTSSWKPNFGARYMKPFFSAASLAVPLGRLTRHTSPKVMITEWTFLLTQKIIERMNAVSISSQKWINPCRDMDEIFMYRRNGKLWLIAWEAYRGRASAVNMGRRWNGQQRGRAKPSKEWERKRESSIKRGNEGAAAEWQCFHRRGGVDRLRLNGASWPLFRVSFWFCWVYF